MIVAPDLFDMDKKQIDDKIDKVVTFLKECEKKLTEKELEIVNKKDKVVQIFLSSINSNCCEIEQCREDRRLEKAELDKGYLIFAGACFLLPLSGWFFDLSNSDMRISFVGMFVFVSFLYSRSNKIDLIEDIKISGLNISNSNLIRETKLEGIPSEVVAKYIQHCYKSFGLYERLDKKYGDRFSLDRLDRTDSEEIEQEKDNLTRGILVFQIRIILMSLQSKDTIFNTDEFKETLRYYLLND